MKKTRIFNGNQYIDSFYCLGNNKATIKAVQQRLSKKNSKAGLYLVQFFTFLTIVVIIYLAITRN